jgi:alpha-beta hydrolase superfamily lysophospholipase
LSTFGTVKIRNGPIELHVAEDGDPSAPPILLLHGISADPAVPGAVADPDLARHFAEISQGVEVLVVDGAGHLIHDELGARDRFRDAAVEFIDRTTTA